MSAVIINVDTALTDVPIIEIGKQGENEATQVVFDVSDMIDTFGSGTAYVVVQRRGDAEPYLLDNTQQSSDKVTWTVSNVDTDVYGMGRVQLFWMIDDQVAKSVNYQFYVEEALGNPTDAPVVPGGWISEKIGDLDELTTTAKENLVAAINEVNALVGGVADDVEGLTGDVETLQTQMETKAEIDGLYEDMTVGNAEQLIASDYVVDKTPYLFRKTGGATDVGNREYDTLVGASAVWNQLVNGKEAVTFTQGQDMTETIQSSINFVSGHKYLACCQQSATLTSVTRNTFQWNDGNGHTITGATNNHLEKGLQAQLFAPVASTTNGSLLYLCHSPNPDVTMDKWNLVDLTTLFGSSTIPDYVYSLEQSTAGSGVAWLKKYLPNLFQYNAYTTPTIESVENVSAHEFVGFNQWDEEWEVGSLDINTGATEYSTNRIRSKNYIPVLPMTTYGYSFPVSASVSTGNISVMLYDAGKNYITYRNWITSGGTFETTQDTSFIKFYTNGSYGETYNHDICINFHYDGERDGEYEPYVKHSYPLDSTITLRGIPKLDANNSLYYDGDSYEADGTVTRRYGIVDLGTLYWAVANTPNNHWRFGASLSDIIRADSSSTVFNGICTKYQSVTPANTYDGVTGISNNNATNTIYVCDETYTDAASFKTAMSGVYLIYELATPTTAEYEPFQSPQICDDFGTEEYVTDCLIPVGHETKYPANLRDKVQHLPDLSNLGNGNYIINQTGTQMSLIPTTSIIPAVPTTNGTYKLKCTVSGGQATLTWEVDS